MSLPGRGHAAAARGPHAALVFTPQDAAAAMPVPAQTVLPPAVPVLPGTLLGLELLLQRPALDLRAARDLFAEDPGALLHLYAALREEFSDTGEVPVRLEDCIASVSVESLLRTLAEAGGGRREHVGFARFARHGALVGRYAQAVADSLGLVREQALLIGMLHELGSLPALLGWSATPGTQREAALRCDEIGRRYHLPRTLRTALEAVHCELNGSVWVAVIAAAHELLHAA